MEVTDPTGLDEEGELEGALFDWLLLLATEAVDEVLVAETRVGLEETTEDVVTTTYELELVVEDVVDEATEELLDDDGQVELNDPLPQLFKTFFIQVAYSWPQMGLFCEYVASQSIIPPNFGLE